MTPPSAMSAKCLGGGRGGGGCSVALGIGIGPEEGAMFLGADLLDALYRAEILESWTKISGRRGPRCGISMMVEAAATQSSYLGSIDFIISAIV